mgnify:CR=1 FL=1
MLHRGLYSTDASIYQIKPLAVAFPKSRDEIIQLIHQSEKQQQPILARGAGTSLTGQSINEAVVLDLSKYMDRVLELNIQERWARVEPGVVCGELNAQLKPHGLHFAPDPATLNRANIGGMISNNSAGMRSVLYGMTIDHVIELELALADGQVLRLSSLDEQELEAKCQQKDREGEIYRGVRKEVEENSTEIQERYPKVIRRSGGYALDALLYVKPWNLAKLICGSEGTLGIILEAKLCLTPLPSYSALCLAHFDTLDSCLRAAAPAVGNGASAVELIDGIIIKQARNHPLTRDICSQIEGDPAAVLVIEAQGDTQDEVANQMRKIADSLTDFAYIRPIIIDEKEIKAVWQMRSSALGLMTTLQGPRKPTPYIEDAAVPPEALADYVAEVLEVCQRYNQPVSLFGHASVGLIHIRPLHDLHQQKDIDQMKKIQAEVFPLVIKYRGSWSGEHGDGIVRGAYNKLFFGEQLYNSFCEVKRLFDPEGRMNPGKILNTPVIDDHLRFGTDYHPKKVQSLFHFRKNGGMLAAAEQCTGVGACRKTLSGVMCPSYMATKDEIHSTRGRANAIRLALTGQLGKEALSGHQLNSVMELCLSCKGCKGECPNSVDMAQLKAEVLYHHQKKHGVNMRTRLFAALPEIGRLVAGPIAPMVNLLLASKTLRSLMAYIFSITPERVLPSFTSQRLSEWFATRNKIQNDKQVILFNDTYTEYFQPQVGRAAIECLEAAGYEIILATLGDSQRIAITHGLLDEAKQKGMHLFQKLDELLETDAPIIMCEPSCASALSDDLPDLLEDDCLAKNISERVIMFDRFLEQELSAGRSALELKISENNTPPQFLVHGHCHQKTLDGGQWTHKLLQRIPGVVITDTEAGCCGMAGTFGYEKEHHELSKKIAQQRLLPKVNEASKQTLVISNGFSCRHQIKDLTTRKPIHVAEALRMFI